MTMGCFYTFCGIQGFIDHVDKRNDLLNSLFDKNVLSDDNVYVVNNGKLLKDNEVLHLDQVYHVIPRLVGGKGGFGSMLRAIGAQIEKTTSREACRDLSGRRMRDVNNEKKLKEWLGKQSEREREKEEKRKERLEKRRHKPQHKFDDPTFFEQKNKVVEDLEDALQKGLEKSKGASATVTSETASGSGECRKRKATGNGTTVKIKKSKRWLGLDPDLDLSDLDTSDEEEEKTGSSSDNNSSNESDKISGADSESHQNDEKLTPEENDSPKKLSEESGECLNKPKQSTLLENLPPPASESQPNLDNEPIILDDYNSIEELEALGLNRLKKSLMEQGLKCGGTLQQRAERLFSVKGLKQEEMDPSLFAKPSKKKGK